MSAYAIREVIKQVSRRPKTEPRKPGIQSFLLTSKNWLNGRTPYHFPRSVVPSFRLLLFVHTSSNSRPKIPLADFMPVSCFGQIGKLRCNENLALGISTKAINKMLTTVFFNRLIKVLCWVGFGKPNRYPLNRAIG